MANFIKNTGQTGVGLSHYTNDLAFFRKNEPLYQNQGTCIFGIPPAALAAIKSSETRAELVLLMAQSVRSIEDIKGIDPGKSVQQRFQFASSNYIGAKPDDTSGVLSIKFKINQKSDLSVPIENIIKAWANLGYDPMTGEQGLKKEYCGDLSIFFTNKRKNTYHQYDYPIIFPIEEATARKLDMDADDLYELTVKFQYDYVNEYIEGIGGNYDTENNGYDLSKGIIVPSPDPRNTPK